MKTRIIYTEIWQDDFFSELDATEKLLFIYYLTNESVNIIHLYRCMPTRASADTGVDTPLVLKAQRRFEEAGKIFFKNNYVYLKNAGRFESYTGESNETAKQKLFDRLSKEILDWYNGISDTPVYTPLITPPRNKKQEIRNPKEETNTDLIAEEVEVGLLKAKA